MRHGYPVVLDDGGRVVPYPEGLRACLRKLGWDRARLAAEAGASPRSVETWLTGRRRPPVNALVVLYVALRRQRASGLPPTAGS